MADQAPTMEYKAPFQVLVSSVDQKSTFTVTTRESDTLESLKKEVAEKSNVSAKQISLSKHGKPLTDDQATLKSLEIQNGSNLQSNVQALGGCGCDCCCW